MSKIGRLAGQVLKIGLPKRHKMKLVHESGSTKIPASIPMHKVSILGGVTVGIGISAGGLL